MNKKKMKNLLLKTLKTGHGLEMNIYVLKYLFNQIIKNKNLNNRYKRITIHLDSFNFMGNELYKIDFEAFYRHKTENFIKKDYYKTSKTIKTNPKPNKESEFYTYMASSIFYTLYSESDKKCDKYNGKPVTLFWIYNNGPKEYSFVDLIKKLEIYDEKKHKNFDFEEFLNTNIDEILNIEYFMDENDITLKRNNPYYKSSKKITPKNYDFRLDYIEKLFCIDLEKL